MNKDTQEKAKDHPRPLYHREDFEPGNEPVRPYRRSKTDGWQPLGNGGYVKEIGPAELYY